MTTIPFYCGHFVMVHFQMSYIYYQQIYPLLSVVVSSCGSIILETATQASSDVIIKLPQRSFSASVCYGIKWYRAAVSLLTIPSFWLFKALKHAMGQSPLSVQITQSRGKAFEDPFSCWLRNNSLAGTCLNISTQWRLTKLNASRNSKNPEQR